MMSGINKQRVNGGDSHWQFFFNEWAHTFLFGNTEFAEKTPNTAWFTSPRESNTAPNCTLCLTSWAINTPAETESLMNKRERDREIYSWAATEVVCCFTIHQVPITGLHLMSLVAFEFIGFLITELMLFSRSASENIWTHSWGGSYSQFYIITT